MKHPSIPHLQHVSSDDLAFIDSLAQTLSNGHPQRCRRCRRRISLFRVTTLISLFLLVLLNGGKTFAFQHNYTYVTTTSSQTSQAIYHSVQQTLLHL